MDPQLVSVENGRDGMLGNAQKTKWASPGDWQAQKQRIIDLYKLQGNTLREVMHIMREKHGFFATQKMYKTHLRQWGVRKNLRAPQVEEFLQQVPLGDEGKSSELIIGGVRTDQQRLQTYVKRARKPRSGGVGFLNKSQLTALQGMAGSQTPHPEQMFLRSYQPDFEKMLHAMRLYLGSWCEIQMPLHSNLELTQNNCSWMVGRLINSGYMAQAFRLLHVCLDGSKDLTACNSLSFLQDVCAIIFSFSRRNAALTKVIISFLRDLYFVSSGSTQHPMYLLYDAMSRMSPQQMCDCAWALVEAHDSILSTELGSDSAFAGELTAIHGRGISWVAACAPVEDSTAERALQKYIQDSSVRAPTKFEDLEANLRLANFYLDRQRYGEAQRVAKEVLPLALGGDRGAEYAYLVDDCYRILFWVSRHEGSREEAAAAAGRWLEHCTARLGRPHVLTVNALGEVAEYLRSNADSATAREARRDYESAIDDMCEQLERVGMNADEHPTQKKTRIYGRNAQEGSSAFH